MTDTRARSSRACSSSMSITAWSPHSGPSIASAACRSTRGSPVRTVSGCGIAGGRPGSNEPSTSRPQTCSNGTLPDQVLDVDPAVAERPTLLVGLGDLGREGDYALETGLNLGNLGHGASLRLDGSRPGE